MVEFNKMFVMLPVMLAARKLDGEDPKTILYLRVAYGIIQTISILIVLYTYVVASSIKSDTVIYVPPPPMPFADPNAKKKYTETTFGPHCLKTARNFVGSTLFGVAMTVGLHYYRGMVMGLAIQAVMAPFSVFENPLVKALFFSSSRSIRIEDKIFGEKGANELTADDEIVDEQGNIVVRRPISADPRKGANNNKATNNKKNNKTVNATGGTQRPPTLEEIMLDTWDGGAKADLTALMSVLNSDNVNTATSEDKWTSLMILAGLGAPGTQSAIRQVLALGADVSKTDVEGWTCLHWAAFHGSVVAAKELVATADVSLLHLKDKDGITALETAKKEKNTAVAEILEKAAAAATTSENDTKKDK